MGSFGDPLSMAFWVSSSSLIERGHNMAQVTVSDVQAMGDFIDEPVSDGWAVHFLEIYSWEIQCWAQDDAEMRLEQLMAEVLGAD
jgi:hypothetical protein